MRPRDESLVAGRVFDLRREEGGGGRFGAGRYIGLGDFGGDGHLCTKYTGHQRCMAGVWVYVETFNPDAWRVL